MGIHILVRLYLYIEAAPRSHGFSTASDRSDIWQALLLVRMSNLNEWYNNFNSLPHSFKALRDSVLRRFTALWIDAQLLVGMHTNVQGTYTLSASFIKKKHLENSFLVICMPKCSKSMSKQLHFSTAQLVCSFHLASIPPLFMLVKIDNINSQTNLLRRLHNECQAQTTEIMHHSPWDLRPFVDKIGPRQKYIVWRVLLT